MKENIINPSFCVGSRNCIGEEEGEETDTSSVYISRRHLRIKNPGRISISHKDFPELVDGRRAGLPGNTRATWPRGIDCFITEYSSSSGCHTPTGDTNLSRCGVAGSF